MPDNATLHSAAAKGALCAVNGIMHGSFDADHLYLDDDNKIRDFNIEKLFDDLFLGRPLDAIFIENFRQYAGLLTQTEVPDDVFDNVISMRQWALPHFGRITIGAPRADGSRLSGTWRQTSQSTAAASGTFSRNAQCQLHRSTR